MFESFLLSLRLLTKYRLISAQETPLERLKIPIRFTVDSSGAFGRVFEQSHYKQLLEILQRTKLRHLELTSLETLSDTPANLQIGSLQLLRLSGPCIFKDTVRFSPILLFLPALAHIAAFLSDFFPKPLRSTFRISIPHSASPRRLLLLRSIFERKRDVESL